MPATRQKKNKMTVYEIKINKFFLKTTFLTFFLFVGFNSSFAQCSCECVAGRVQPVCSKTPHMKPICPPRICMASRTKVPIPKKFVPTTPKIKPSNCQQRRVKNPNTNQYIWRTICRPENSFQ